jgi:EmrB/QacA subfamily drug resistance transporter
MKNRTRWIILGLLALAQFMVVLDTSVANVALPAIQKTLHFDTSALQWIITAYALTFGGFLLLGGRAADLFGRRKILLMGIIGFTITSFLIGIANSPIEIIAFRALQGLTAALMSPSALSIVLTTFQEGKARNRAFGIWATVASGGAAVGLLLGGVLTEYLNWRWNFFINIPIGILATIGILKFVPKHESTLSHRHLDLTGAALVTTGLMALVYGLTEAPNWGWLSLPTLGTLAAAIALIGGFIWNESRVAHPLVPLSIFKIRNVSGANAIMMPIIAGMLGMFYLLSLYVQMVMHYQPVEAGLAFIGFPIVLAIVSNLIPKYLHKIGTRRSIIIGSSLVAAGLLWLGMLTLTSSYAFGILPAVILIAGGMGMMFVSITIIATSGVPANEAGLASGLLNTTQQMGGALGLAILSGIATSVAQANQEQGATAALLQGDKIAFITAAGFAIIALLLAIFVIKEKPQAQHKESVAKAEPVAIH